MTNKSTSSSKRNRVTINGIEYVAIRRKTGMRKNSRGEWRSEYKIFYGRTKREATAKYNAYVNKVSFEADKPLGELIEQYIDAVLMSDSSLKETTKSRYCNAFDNCFGDSKLLEMPLSAITGVDIQRAINTAPVAPSSVKQACNLIKRFYKYCAAEHIAVDVTKSLVLPEIEHRRQNQNIETFTDEELRAFIEKTPITHRLRFLIILGINTGARGGELLALKYSDFQDDSLFINRALIEIDPIKGTGEKARVEISDTKSQTSNRTLPINADIIDALQAHKKWHTAEMKNNGYKTDYIFTTSAGKLYFKSTVRTAFKRLCKQVGVAPKGFHSFRRTFGTKLAVAGVPISTLSALMGHSDISVTARYYIGVPTDAKKSALNKLKLY